MCALTPYNEITKLVDLFLKKNQSFTSKDHIYTDAPCPNKGLFPEKKFSLTEQLALPVPVEKPEWIKIPKNTKN